MALKRIFLMMFALIFIIKNTYAINKDFMVGFYSFPNKHYIDLVSNSKIDFLIPYGTDGMKDKELKEFLNYAEKKNVKIIFSLKDCYKTSKWYPNNNSCASDNEELLVKCLVAKYDAYKSLIGYYLSDDGTDTIGSKNLILYKNHVRNIKALSTKKIFVNDYPPNKGKLLEVFSQTSDYLIVGLYPIPEKQPEEVYKVIKETVDTYKKPIIALIQAHGKYQYPFYKRNEITGRPPSLIEIEQMVNLSIKAGASGIIFYSLFDVEKLPDGKERLEFIKKLIEDLKKGDK